jgi:hypothetical protein
MSRRTALVFAAERGFLMREEREDGGPGSGEVEYGCNKQTGRAH